jgi:uncharacterized protein (DUF427 family)
MAAFEPPPPRLEPTPRWIRVRAGDTWIADSRRAQLLVWFGPGRLPTYVFPPEDVRTDLIGPAGDVLCGGRTLEGVARRFGPGELAPEGHWTFTWDGRVSWFEEAMEVVVHARDPSKRVDAIPSDRHVEVRVDGELVAESRSAHALFETDLPTRWYLPAHDVRGDVLEPSHTATSCPYKGTARYWHVRTGEALHEDLVWSYGQPIPECPRIAGLLCFFNERVDLTIDGQLQSRPLTPWTPAP